MILRPAQRREDRIHVHAQPDRPGGGLILPYEQGFRQVPEGLVVPPPEGDMPPVLALEPGKGLGSRTKKLYPALLRDSLLEKVQGPVRRLHHPVLAPSVEHQVDHPHVGRVRRIAPALELVFEEPRVILGRGRDQSVVIGVVGLEYHLSLQVSPARASPPPG